MGNTFYPENDYRNYLEHHGILGMKWGVRRFQNKDGSYTSAGKQRYGVGRSGAKEEAGSGRSGGKDLDNSKNKVSGLGFSKQYKNDDEFRKDVLKKNPFAAIANVDAAKWVGEHKKEILIGSAVVAASVAIGVAAYTNRGALSKLAATSMNDPAVKEAAKMHHGIDYAKPANAYMAAWCDADIHRFDPLPDIKSLTNDDAVNLPQGHIMHRIVDKPFEQLRYEPEYICHSADDAERYKAFLPKMWKANGARISEFYQLEVECKTAIKAPGKKDSVDLMMQAVRNVNGWGRFPPSPLMQNQLERDVKQNFYRYQVNLIDRHNELTQEYFRLARQKGFNAVIDYNDAGRLADSPLILLNGDEVGQVNKVVKMSMSDANEAMRNIKVPKALENFKAEDFWNEPKHELYEGYIKKFNKGAA